METMLWLVVYTNDMNDYDEDYKFNGIFDTEDAWREAYKDITWIHVKEFSTPDTWQGRSLHFGFKESNYSRHWSKADFMVDLVRLNKRKDK